LGYAWGSDYFSSDLVAFEIQKRFYTTSERWSGVERLDKSAIVEVIETARKEGRKILTEPEAKRILQAGGVPVNKTELATTLEETVRLARDINYPVTIKVVSPDITHKSDCGGVRTGIGSETELRRAYQEVLDNARAFNPRARIFGVSVQEHLPSGTEVIVGGLQDKSFGPTVMFGLGGIWVELLKDVSFRLAPLEHEQALEMLKEIKGYPLLCGYRGRPEADRDALAEAIVKTGAIISEFREIQELDINPLFVFEKGKGVKAVDARIVLGESNG
jgi:acyl-CoA synthetase (NDP forming)